MDRPLKVVVLEAAPGAAERVGDELGRCGFTPEVSVADAEADLAVPLPGTSDLVIAWRDPALPTETILEAVAARRQGPPVLVLATTFTEQEIVAFMRAGARDCLHPGDTERLKAAVERELRAQAPAATPTPDAPPRAEEGGEERYRTLIEEIPALTYVAWADETGSRAYVSPQLVSMTGFSPAEWMAEPDLWARQLHPEDRERVLLTFREACAAGTRFACEYRLVDRGGRVLWWRDEGRVVAAPDGKARFVRGFVLDVTAQKLAEQAARRLRFYDQGTGLPNRVLLLRRLGKALAESSRGARPLALIFLALDRFRDVISTLGHHNGEQIVRELAGRLGEVLGERERAFRVRGDEFGVLLPDADAGLARHVGQSLLEALERPFMVQKLPIEVSASIGIAVAPDHATEAELLLRRADAAVQAARRQGGGACVLYSAECEPHDPARLALLGELRRALEANELLVHYQPKVDLKTRSIVGAEALLRWPHPRRGMVSPGDFVPLAEQTAVIRPLTRWVIGRALADSRGWEGVGRALPVAVNLSARCLQDAQIVGEVTDVLQTHDVAPQRLQLEVTESAVMGDTGRASEILGRITARGITVSIDDFGTGYSSLAALRRLPVSELKIDKSFVTGMRGDTGEDTAIVRSTNDLAHNLGLTVVAEGVEDEWTLDLLANFGCDQAQGYHIAKPMPSADFTVWLARSTWRASEP
jgi:diguanylate cyclase (GGDEF)-like protein/PAS domain S-box-containing protein